MTCKSCQMRESHPEAVSADLDCLRCIGLLMIELRTSRLEQLRLLATVRAKGKFIKRDIEKEIKRIERA